MIGSRAYHPRGGWCVIKSLSRAGVSPRVLVDFEFARNREVPFAELLDGPNGAALACPPDWLGPVAVSVASEDQSQKPTWHEARLSILALRLGQVTEALVTQLSVGTDEVESISAEVVRSATDRKPMFLVVEGPWGTGKTHALALFNAIARKLKFATATVVLDGVAVTLGRPQDLLRAIVHEVTFAQNPGVYSFSERIAEFVRGGRTRILADNGAHTLAAALGKIPSQLADDPDAWEIIENYVAGEISASACAQALRPFHDRPLQLLSLATRYRDERPGRSAEMIQEWASACRVMPTEGLSHGLAVLFDEADVELDLGGRSKVELEQRELFLQRLGELRSVETPLCVVFAVAPGSAGHLPGLFSPTDYLVQHLGDLTKVVTVPRLTPEMMLRVAEVVAELYSQAYPDHKTVKATIWRPFAEKHVRGMHRAPEGIVPRSFIRLFIEFLDVNSLNSNGHAA